MAKQDQAKGPREDLKENNPEINNTTEALQKMAK